MSEERGPSPSMSLPDALAGLRRPSGTPDSLYQRCKDFTKAAAQLDDVGDDFARLLHKVPGPWKGTSQAEFSQVMGGRPGNYRKAAAGYRKAGIAVKEYASALENAQQTWDASRQLADADWHRQIPGALATPPDPFSPDRVRARKQVEAALERLRGTTLRSIGVLKALEATLGPRSRVKPEIARGRGAAMMQAWDELYEKGRADWDEVWDLHRLVMPGQAKDAWKEKWNSYFDDKERACTDPVRHAGDEAYDYANVEEFQAGNDARAWAGVAYNASGGLWKIGKQLISPDGKGKHDTKKDDEKEEEKKKSACSP